MNDEPKFPTLDEIIKDRYVFPDRRPDSVSGEIFRTGWEARDPEIAYWKQLAQDLDSGKKVCRWIQAERESYSPNSVLLKKSGRNREEKIMSAEQAAKLGVSAETIREMIKPVVMLMHRNRIASLTIKLENGIATLSAVKPPSSRIRDEAIEGGGHG